VLNLLRSLLEATLAAHGQGVVHRDIKPENVFLRDDGQVLLLDFGMAKLTAGLDLAVSGFMTESGMILGTPHYMAPEQLHGERDVDGRADVWALGVVTYECLSGERPLTGKSFGQILRAMSRHELVDISERVPSLAPPVAELVRRMLTPDRTERPHASAVLSSLSSL
jgi:serine/threonine-protein kinase